MGMSAEDYFASMQADLPTGPAWPRQREGALEALLRAVAAALADAEARADQLQNEADPRTAFETLDDWERVLGLPDACLGPAQSVTLRREAVYEKEIAEGSLHIESYRALAARMGFPNTTFRLHRAFRCGRSRCGRSHTLGPGDQAHKITVEIPGVRKVPFRCGRSRVGRDPLTRTLSGEGLACVLRRERPAHIQLVIRLEE